MMDREGGDRKSDSCGGNGACRRLSLSPSLRPAQVMVGFGRTGKMWGFQNYEGVVPDIMTSAKGLTGAYLPLSLVGVRSHIKVRGLASWACLLAVVEVEVVSRGCGDGRWW